MAQYIDKDALVAKIRSRLLPAVVPHGTHYDDWDRGADNERMFILSLINTLEVKEVDLEKEIQVFSKMELEPIKIYDANASLTITMHQLYQCAKHFFELGLKAQQNINIDITNIDKVIEENGVDPNSKEAKVFKESYYIALEKLKVQKGE